MAKMTPKQIGEFLALPNIAHSISLRAGSTPHSVPVWHGFSDNRSYVFTPASSLKMRNIRNDPRISLSIANAAKPYSYVVASGVADIVHDGIKERFYLSHLATKALREEQNI